MCVFVWLGVVVCVCDRVCGGRCVSVSFDLQ